MAVSVSAAELYSVETHVALDLVLLQRHLVVNNLNDTVIIGDLLGVGHGWIVPGGAAGAVIRCLLVCMRRGCLKEMYEPIIRRNGY